MTFRLVPPTAVPHASAGAKPWRRRMSGMGRAAFGVAFALDHCASEVVFRFIVLSAKKVMALPMIVPGLVCHQLSLTRAWGMNVR